MSGILVGLPHLSVVVTAICSVAIVFFLQRNAASHDATARIRTADDRGRIQ